MPAPSSPKQALTALFPVLAGREQELLQALESAADAVRAKLSGAPAIHFARWMLLPAGPDRTVEPARLLFASTFDGELEAHLLELWGVVGGEVAHFSSHCTGWRSRSGPADFVRFVHGGLTPMSALYSAHPGLSVERIHADAALRRTLGDFLDAHQAELSAQTPEATVNRLRAWAIDAETAVSLARLDDEAHALPERGVARILAGHGLALLVTWVRSLGHDALDALRALWHDVRPNPHAALEAPGVVSATAQGIERSSAHLLRLKPGRFRRAALRLALRVTHELGRLGKPWRAAEAIHAARFILLPDGRLVLLADYTGSGAACVGALVDRSSAKLSALFSQLEHFPPSLGWFFGGARNEARFRAWLRASELGTPIAYSAYPGLSALEIRDNAEIRSLLPGELDRAGAKRLLALLKD